MPNGVCRLSGTEARGSQRPEQPWGNARLGCSGEAPESPGENHIFFSVLSLLDLVTEKGSIWCSRVLNTCPKPSWLS